MKEKKYKDSLQSDWHYCYYYYFYKAKLNLPFTYYTCYFSVETEKFDKIVFALPTFS